jgi:hypothetical protein
MKASFEKLAVAAIFLASAALPALSQSDIVRSIYNSSASVPTNIEGIRTFAAPPADFNPMTAAPETLAMYGFPQRPDAAADPHSFVSWQRAMSHAKKQVNNTQLKLHPEAVLGPMKLSAKQPVAAAAKAGEATPSQFGSTNWSGFANSNKLTKWNASSSFDKVFSEFNTPVVDQTFGTCNPIEWEVTWNGLDGAFDGTVLQGGSSSQSFCKNGTVTASYFAWIEWYPSYPIVEVYGINPGDDIYVNTYSTQGGCNPGFVYIEDETTLSFGTYQLTWKNGPCLVGNSAEFIVERPFGDSSHSSGFYALANYIWDFALSWDYTGKGVESGPGSTAASNLQFSMLDDAGDQVISQATSEGKYSIFVADTGCAYTGGCK